MGNILFNAHKFNGAVFYYIQAAEKAIKALLYLLNLHPWGHSILNLLKEYEKKGKKISIELKKIAKELERHYTRSRYPDALPMKSPKDVYTKNKAQVIRDKSKIFLEFVKNEMEAINQIEE